MKTKNRVNKLMRLYCTGLTDEMRNDFMLMKDLAVHTRVDPKARNQNLMRFMGSIQRCVCCNCVTKHTKQGFIMSSAERQLVFTRTTAILISDQKTETFPWGSLQMGKIILTTSPTIDTWIKLPTTHPLFSDVFWNILEGAKAQKVICAVTAAPYQFLSHRLFTVNLSEGANYQTSTWCVKLRKHQIRSLLYCVLKCPTKAKKIEFVKMS